MRTGNAMIRDVERKGIQPPGLRMHDGMKMGAPTLRVRNIERTLGFYERDLGLQLKQRHQYSDDGLEVLELGFDGIEEPLLVLKHDPKAKETPHDSAGLYHYAILVPDRKSLASTYQSLRNSGTPYEGFANHLVSESLYLHDLERNGIEIYADRPRKEWLNNRGELKMGTYALDFDSLLSELTSEERKNPLTFPRGAGIGHMHLRVTSLERSVRFYRERLGFDLMFDATAMGAAFLSVGGYHHHVGLNTWHSKGGSPHNEGEAGLENFKIIVPDKDELELLKSRFADSSLKDGRLSISDPDGMRILIESA